DGVTGRLQLRSGDGSIRGRAVGGEVDVHTGDGSVTLEGRLTGVRAHTGDGSVTIRADEGSTTGGDWDVTTGDGSVTLAIPDGFGAELDAHTGDGGIRTQDITVSNVTGRISRNSLRGRLGNGGHNLRGRTGDGSITIKRSWLLDEATGGEKAPVVAEDLRAARRLEAAVDDDQRLDRFGQEHPLLRLAERHGPVADGQIVALDHHPRREVVAP